MVKKIPNMSRSSLFSPAELFRMGDAEMYQLSINGKSKAVRNQMKKEMWFRAKIRAEIKAENR